MPARQVKGVGSKGCEGATVVGVDVGLRRSVFSVVGYDAHAVFNNVVVRLMREGIPVLRLGDYDNYHVFDITYPGVDGYRAAELTYNLFEKVGAVLLKALSLVDTHDIVTAISLEHLGNGRGYMQRVIRTWRLLLLALLGSTKVIDNVLSKLHNAIWCSEGWFSYVGYVVEPRQEHMPYLLLVNPEYGSQVCPICHRYLGQVNRGVTITCPVCGFKGDADVIGSLNTALRGCCILRRYLGDGSWKSPMAPWPLLLFLHSILYQCLIYCVT